VKISKAQICQKEKDLYSIMITIVNRIAYLIKLIVPLDLLTGKVNFIFYTDDK